MSKLLQDKQSIMHVFSSLLHDPTILGNDRDFPLSVDDFPEPFHKVVFSAINNLYIQGAEVITPVEIDGYLSRFDKAYQIFNANMGVDYLENTIELGTPENFELHYNRLRKFSFLRACDNSGIDITEIMDTETIDPKFHQEQQDAFDNMPLEEMVTFMESKMIGLRDQFLHSQDHSGGHIGDIADDILTNMKEGLTYGAPLLSRYYTASTLGAKMSKMHLLSAPSGTGKSRWSLGNARALSVPVLYDRKQEKWFKNPTTGEGVLYIGTELEEEEFTQPLICSIADIDEDQITEGRVTPEEWKRLELATKVLKESPLYYERMPEYDIADLDHIIQQYVIKHNVRYIFMDYIEDNVKLMSYFQKINKNMRPDERLLQVSRRLKDIAQKYNIFVYALTQVNSNYKEEGNLDETSIAGAKAMVNKVDIGSIMTILSASDEKILENILKAHGDFNGKINGFVPNTTINIYKSRGTKWKLIRIWAYFDRGRLRMHDLFVTDYKGRIIEELKPVDVLFNEDNNLLDTMPLEIKKDTIPNKVETFDELENTDDTDFIV